MIEFRRLPPLAKIASSLHARLLHRLVLCVGLPAIFGLVVWLAPIATFESKPVAPQTDTDLFRAVVRHMEDGQPYYEVLGTELRANGYPAGSVFNWRQPLLYRTLALFHRDVISFLLIALSLALVVEAGLAVNPTAAGVMIVCSPVLLMALDGLIEPLAGRLSTELWAGACIGLSVLAYARDRAISGAVWALLALFIRELSAPYCVLGALLAVRGQRWREVKVWIFGAAFYGIYYALHSWQAFRHMQPDDVTHANSWLYFGGFPFLLKTWKVAFLPIVPSWIFALVVVAVVVAWWAPRMPLHLRASVVLYSMFFLVAGQPFNDYWGWLTGSLIPLWLAYAPQGLRELVMNAGLDRLSWSRHWSGIRSHPRF